MPPALPRLPAGGRENAPPPLPCAAEAPLADPAPVREVARRLAASVEIVSVAPAAPAVDSVADVATAVPAAETQLARVKAGRLRLAEAMASLRAYDGFDESALVVRARATGKKLPLGSLDPRLLLAAIPSREDRASVACYLRARGLPSLARALNGDSPTASR